MILSREKILESNKIKIINEFDEKTYKTCLNFIKKLNNLNIDEQSKLIDLFLNKDNDPISCHIKHLAFLKLGLEPISNLFKNKAILLGYDIKTYKK